MSIFDRLFKGSLEEQLIRAAARGETSKIESLIAKGADVNARPTTGNTALHLARNCPSVKILLESGADIDARDDKDWTALHTHITLDRNDVALLLIAEGADVNAAIENGETPLHMASGKVNGENVVEALLRKGSDPAAIDNEGNTPLLLGLLLYASEKTVEILIHNGSDVNAANHNGITPLIACIKDYITNEEIMEKLLTAGARVDERDKDGRTALSYAKEFEQNELVEMLLKHGAGD